MKNKKTLLIAGGAVLVAVILGLIIFFVVKNNKKENEPTLVVEEVKKKKKISAPQNLIELSQRPIVSLKPFSKDGGRHVSIVVKNLRLPATAADYEIVYNVTGTSAVSASGSKIKAPTGEEEGGLQAFAGELDLNSLPTSTENRFGTCSAGGACINNNVSGGFLTLNFDAAEKYGVTSNWTYFETGKAESAMQDGSFTINAPELAKASDYLIMESMGLPDGLVGQVVMVPDGGKDNGTKPVAFQLSFTNTPTIKEASVKFSDKTGNKVAVWDDKTWTNYDLTAKLPAGDGYIYALINE